MAGNEHNAPERRHSNERGDTRMKDTRMTTPAVLLVVVAYVYRQASRQRVGSE